MIILGNGAVGKMTVGQELSKITDLRLFHNHASIEPVIEVFGYYHKKAVGRIREIIFEEFLSTDLYGMIFTYMMDFGYQEEWDYIAYLTKLFKDKGAEVFYIELVAPQEIRLQRNSTDNRLINKASKRDVETSNQRLINDDLRHRCESYDGEVPWPNYIKIDNSNLSPQEVALKIRDKFQL